MVLRTRYIAKNTGVYQEWVLDHRRFKRLATVFT